MPGTQDIKRQISSVKATQQITSAMELVAASRLRRAQERAEGSRPYAQGLEALLGRLMDSRAAVSDPLLATGKEGPKAYILVTADRGLCGGYNTNATKLFMSQLSGAGDGSLIITVGRKGRDHLRRQGIPILEAYHFPDDVTYLLSAKVASDATQLFLSGRASEVHVVYTRFISTVAQRPTSVQLLPMVASPAEVVEGETVPRVPYILEPSPSHLLSSLLPKYLAVQVHRALLESKAGELGARMVAMGSATDNADDLIQSLDLRYNRERQAAITREITEIVGGANALK